MPNDYVRVKVYDPKKKKYTYYDYQCNISEIYYLDDSKRYFSIHLPDNQIVIQGDDEDEDEYNCILGDIDCELDNIHYEVKDLLECIDESIEELSAGLKKYTTDHVEKLRVLRAKLENLSLEFCDIM